MKMENAVLDVAKKNNGIVTVKDIKALGYSESALRQFARRNDDIIGKQGGGVYMVYDADGVDPRDASYAAALAMTGDESYLSGSSVLDFYNLANANPRWTTVRTPHHISRKLPGWLRVIHDRRQSRNVDVIRGIRLQNLSDAFLEAKDTRLDYRLEAVDEAEQRNLLSPIQADMLRDVLKKGVIV
ncbi:MULTISPECIES: type IV toxin-antitoxin system AbiEi family antitoxin domain-containing protein [Bifidobacterium]|nr:MULTISPECIES: type IV toxin-antitoxin system AbiEi family antitoxin domain-containing protein [Bifidobacterium]QOL31469.1 hypothetical protein BE0216_02590 [Bifidobacterium eulemuris]QOL33808.1 hypothetical protein BL8807_08490 [Bifidobacterium lemurum]